MMVWNDGGAANVTVTVTDHMTLVEDLGRRFEAGQGFAVATLNLDHVVKLSGDETFQAAYAAHTHVTADGNPIVWLSRLAGQDVSLVPGSELVKPLVALAATHEIPVAFFGATQDVLKATVAELHFHYPSLQVVLCYAPPMGFDPEGASADAGIAAIAASGARLCFLALGAPKQEIFAARAHMVLPQAGFISVGAGLDFIAGTQRRAPSWVRAIAAEWFWRLLSDPKRLGKRYAECLEVLPGLTRRAMRLRKQIKTRP